MGFLKKILPKPSSVAKSPVTLIRASPKQKINAFFSPVKALSKGDIGGAANYVARPGGSLQDAKDEADKKKADAKKAAAAAAQAAKNPFSQAMQNAPGAFVPGFGYVDRGQPAPANPFQSVMNAIPAGFFSSPAAQQMLSQVLGLRQAAPMPVQKPPYQVPWGNGVGPGPMPNAQTLMGQVGGLGNGGGKMGPIDYSKLPYS